MLTQERQDRIVEIVNEKSTVTVGELSEILEASESTVRRDLIRLDRIGLIKKVHGGATSQGVTSSIVEADMNTKLSLNVKEKEAIGRAAAALITNEDFVFIDAGTTTLVMTDAINEGVRATFVTNGIVHAKKLIQKGLKAYIIGGQIKLSTEAVVGTEAISNMSRFNFTKAFIGVNGITAERGFTTPDPEEAAVKASAMARCRKNFVLADHTKFDKVCPVTFAELENAVIITDELENNEYREHTIIKEAGL